VIVSPDGYALTNFHVVQPAGVAMKCGLSDGSLHDAVLVGLDPTGDVALVKLVGRDDFPFVELADSDQVAVGDACFAAGNPFLLATDLAPSISFGIVSGIHRYQFPAGTILEYADCLQVDAAINISSNQLRNFLGSLKGGRLVDHATLGATAATAEDGRVVVSDILETSDAWRRGLRYDDEIVAVAGRPVRTVNALKNVLGIFPSGWRVPVVSRRGARRRVDLVRLASLHTSGELARIISGGEAPPRGRPGGGEPPDGGDAPPPPGAPGGGRDGQKPAVVLPESLAGLYEPRVGFTNFHFNTVERDRVAGAVAARYPGLGAGPWILTGRLAKGEPFRIELSDRHATIDLPTGTSSIDPAGELDAVPAPPGSGGLLAALVVWRRLLLAGPAPLGRTTYWGTAPLWSVADGAVPETTSAPGTPGGPALVDVLDSAVSSVEARFEIAADGAIVGMELWPTPDADPCEVRFLETDAGQGGGGVPGGLPGGFDVRHADEVFGTFRIESFEAGRTAGGDS